MYYLLLVRNLHNSLPRGGTSQREEAAESEIIGTRVTKTMKITTVLQLACSMYSVQSNGG